MNLSKVIVRTLARLVRPVVVEAVAQHEAGGAGRPGTTGLSHEAVSTIRRNLLGMRRDGWPEGTPRYFGAKR